MDVERLRFLCGDGAVAAADDYELDAESGRELFVEDFLALPADASDRAARMAVRSVALNQILDDEPPETWQTVERLRGLGLDREQVLSQITMVITRHVLSALDGDDFDRGQYTDRLHELPLPAVGDIAQRLVDVARATPGIEAGDHADAVVADLDPVNSELVASLVEKVLETMIDGALHWLPDDATVVVPDLVDGRVFTRRFTDAESELQVLNAGFDLGALSRF